MSLQLDCPGGRRLVFDADIYITAFFKAAWKDWEANYDELRLIFRQACQYEIGLWAVGENPGPVS